MGLEAGLQLKKLWKLAFNTCWTLLFELMISSELGVQCFWTPVSKFKYFFGGQHPIFCERQFPNWNMSGSVLLWNTAGWFLKSDRIGNRRLKTPGLQTVIKSKIAVYIITRTWFPLFLTFGNQRLHGNLTPVPFFICIWEPASPYWGNRFEKIILTRTLACT